MTERETGHVISMVRLKWPRSHLGDDPDQVLDSWHDDLKGFEAADVQAAVKRLVASGREWAPNSGEVANEVRVALQGPAPSFDDLQAWLARNCWRLPVGTCDTALAVELLAGAGAHEAVLRFVASHGIYAACRMPDSSLHGLDPNQQADRRDRARDYQHRVLEDWRRDPRPGLALQRARAALEPGSRPGLRRLEPVTATEGSAS